MPFPDYPEEPQNEAQEVLQMRFAKVLGSAVNPVLREGNSDRRAALSVKKFAQKNPHRMMKNWPESGSKTRVAHMQDKDFFGSEKSLTTAKSMTVKIVFTAANGSKTVLKEGIQLQAGEVVDTAVMNVAALRRFFCRNHCRSQR
jgi:isocitrate dehydrogenase